MSDISVLSLFANIGVSEAYLDKLGISVKVANELDQRRAELYTQIYPNCKMITGDIESETVFSAVIDESKKEKVNVILATPPCQGVSTVGQQKPNDPRNRLILSAIRAIRILCPDYAFIENVPLIMDAVIDYDGTPYTVGSIITKLLESEYHIEKKVINTDEYGVPQSRERIVILPSRKGKAIWTFPLPEKNKVTMRDAIGDLPPLDPFVKDLSSEELAKKFPLYEKRRLEALSISPWHVPPVHVWRQVRCMMYTPTGCTAFDNPKEFKPVKTNGDFVKGFKNTYKRQEWDIPAYTVTMDNRKISSQNNVHPGRLIGQDSNGRDVYSDARTLTVYELMKIMSIPDDWPIPTTTSGAFLRSKIGEGIPPLFVKKVFQRLPLKIERER